MKEYILFAFCFLLLLACKKENYSDSPLSEIEESSVVDEKCRLSSVETHEFHGGKSDVEIIWEYNQQGMELEYLEVQDGIVRGKRSDYKYDNEGRVIQFDFHSNLQKDFFNGTYSFEFNEFGDTTKVFLNSELYQLFEYDSKRRLKRKFSSFSNINNRIRRLSIESKYVFDSDDRIDYVKNTLGSGYDYVTEYTYDQVKDEIILVTIESTFKKVFAFTDQEGRFIEKRVDSGEHGFLEFKNYQYNSLGQITEYSEFDEKGSLLRTKSFEYSCK